jgi:hypothetical protein
MFELWNRSGQQFVGNARTSSGHSSPTRASYVTVVQTIPESEQFKPRVVASTLSMFFLTFKRSWVQHSRSKVSFVIDNLLVFVASLFLALVYFDEIVYTPPEPIEVFRGCSADIGKQCQLCLSVVKDQILNRGSMTCIAMGLTGVASMIRVFGEERVQYWREASGLPQPWHTIAYFFGKDASMVPQFMLAPLVYCVIYLNITTPRGDFAAYYIVLLGVYYVAAGFAYIVSIVSPPGLAQLVGVVTIFANSMFAGGAPVLKQLLQLFEPLRWFPRISFGGSLAVAVASVALDCAATLLFCACRSALRT